MRYKKRTRSKKGKHLLNRSLYKKHTRLKILMRLCQVFIRGYPFEFCIKAIVMVNNVCLRIRAMVMVNVFGLFGRVLAKGLIIRLPITYLDIVRIILSVRISFGSGNQYCYFLSR